MNAGRLNLLQRQQQLIEKIFTFIEPHHQLVPATDQGLKIYQNNLLMTATRALMLSYPVIQKMLGKEAMTALAKQLLEFDPPNHGDWAEWGEKLADYITKTSLIKDHPFLYDTAKLEWKIHQVSRGMEGTVNLATLSRLTDYDLKRVHIELTSATALYQSKYPMDAIWMAHQPVSSGYQIDDKALEQAIEQHEDSCLLFIHQHHQLPQLKRLTEPEYQWLANIIQGYSIAELLESQPGFDFVGWFSSAIKNNWIKQITLNPVQTGEKQ